MTSSPTPAVLPDARAREVRLRMFLEILEASCGQADASDYRWNWINAFCGENEGYEPDTFNTAHDAGYTTVSHDTDTDSGIVRLTEVGRVYLTTPPASDATVTAGKVTPVELRALSDRATPGPWAWEQCGEKEDVPVIGIAFPGDDPDCKAPYDGEFRDSDANRMTIAYDWQSCDGHPPSANAAFAVAAVNYVRAMLAAAPKVASDTTMPFGLPLSNTDLTRLYEGSKRDALPVGSEVRQLVAEVRYHRGNSIPVAYLLTKAGSFEEFSRSPLTDADKAGGWTETPLYVRSGHSL